MSFFCLFLVVLAEKVVDSMNNDSLHENFTAP
jgi:hypothetical protein